ncbi:MAG: hypothetical protein A3E80_00505 [Chlamydiae bacterium RIFCSPHIGHO2_12_FULL_49_9]|nr:MAG: hypothetical protein A3E80_00505 [Chlamydiae bacterium RIFCSPHIGHO2_12_FULL_49_9]
MNVSACLVVAISLLGGCQSAFVATKAVYSNQILDYRVDGNRYAVVVTQDQGVTRAMAKKFARERAAEITVDNGYRYFIIESEEQVQTVRTGDPVGGKQEFHENMYHEQIIEGDFYRRPSQFQETQPGGTFPAIRIVFKCYEQRPGIRAIDACTLTNCD